MYLIQDDFAAADIVSAAYFTEENICDAFTTLPPPL